MAALIPALDRACATADAMRGAAINALLDLDRRITGLRRATDFLRGSAEQLLVPLLPELPKIPDIDIVVYNRLRLACPLLPLPALDVNSLIRLPILEQLNAFRNAVIGAYLGLLNKLENSALGMIAQLEKQLNKIIDKALEIASPFVGLIECVCGANNAFTNLVEINKARSVLDSVYPNRPSLLNDQLRTQVQQLNGVKDQIKIALGPSYSTR